MRGREQMPAEVGLFGLLDHLPSTCADGSFGMFFDAFFDGSLAGLQTQSKSLALVARFVPYRRHWQGFAQQRVRHRQLLALNL